MQKFSILTSPWSSTGWFETFLVTNPKGRFSHKEVHTLTICILKIPKQVLLQTVKTQMKYSITIVWRSLTFTDSIDLDEIHNICNNLRQNFASAQYLGNKIGRISPNFIYAFLLTRSNLGLLHIIFHTFVPELWSLIYAKILFPLNILRTNWQNFTKFYMSIHIEKI